HRDAMSANSSGEHMRRGCCFWPLAKTVFGRHRRPVRSPELPVRTVRTVVTVAGVIAILWLCLPKPPLLDGISFSQCIRDRNGKLLRITLSADQKFRIRTPLSGI